MKIPLIALPLLILLLNQAGDARTLPADDTRIAALGADNPETQVKALHELVGIGAPAVAPLTAVLDRSAERSPAAKMAYETLFRMVQVYAGTDRAADVEAALVGELKAQHAVATKRSLCILLGYIAEQNQSIDTLYLGMNDRELRETVRQSLARIPGRRATQCLMGALQITQDESRLGVIASLGTRGDPMAASYLAPGAEDVDPAVCRAVLNALALLPAPHSLEGLMAAHKAGKPGAVSALIRLMETLMDAGLYQAAEIILKLVTESSSLSEQEQCRLLHACGRLGTKEATAMVISALTADSSRLRAAAVQACTLFPTRDLTDIVADQMGKAAGSRKIELIEALGTRGRWMTDAAAEKIVAATADPEESVRVAAIGAIEAAGIDAGVPALLKMLTGSSGPTREVAEKALNHMSGQGATSAIAGSLDGASAEVSVRLLGALARRGDTSAVPVVIKAARSDVEAVRVAALRAVGLLQAEAGLDVLVAALRSDSSIERDVAIQATQRLQGEFVTPRLLAAYRDTPKQHKAALLRVIGARKHVEVPALLASEAESENSDIRAAAIEGLGRQDDPSLVPRLLAVARKGPAQVTEAAVGGCLRTARRLEGADRVAAGRVYVEVLPLAVNDEQKRQALDGVARCSDTPPADLLPLVVPLLQREEEHSSAARVAARIAVNLPESRRAEAVSVLQQVLKSRPDQETAAKAAEHLRRLGVDIDPAREAGFITRWHLLGPLPNPRNEMWDKSYELEEKVDLKQSLKTGGKELRWQPYHTQGLEGIMNMDAALGPDEYVGAYAYAEISVEAAQDAVFRIGSDDSLVVWLNGTKVYAYNGARGVRVDEDTAQVRLQAGINRVLVKSLDQINDWGFCIRVTTPDGKPLAFKQKAE